MYLSVFAHEALVCLTYMFMPVAFLQPVCSVTLSDSDSVCLQDPATPRVSPAHSPPENGLDKSRVLKKDVAPNSPASVASSGSTPSSKAKDHAHVSGTDEMRRPERADRLGDVCQSSVCEGPTLSRFSLATVRLVSGGRG